jgi:hypothetical protein
MGTKTAGMLLRIMANNAIRDVLDLNIDSTKAFEKIEMIVCGVQEIDEELGLRAKLEEENKEQKC